MLSVPGALGSILGTSTDHFHHKMSTYIDLLRRAGVPSVVIRWQRLLATEVYKALHGLSPLYVQNLFNENNLPYNLRTSKIIIQPKCNTKTNGLNSLTYQGAKLLIVYQNTLKLLRVLTKSRY